MSEMKPLYYLGNVKWNKNCEMLNNHSSLTNFKLTKMNEVE